VQARWGHRLAGDLVGHAGRQQALDLLLPRRGLARDDAE
jgi:hypothetical protein